MATADWVDANQNAGFVAADSGTISITTAGADEVLVLWVSTDQSNANAPSGVSVASVSDTAGLTWYKRKALPFQDSNTYQRTLEIWWAKKPTAGATTITVTMNVTIDNAALGVTAFKNLPNPSAPWDSNASLPVSDTNVTGSFAPLTATVTTNGTPLVLAFCGGLTGDATSADSYTRLNFRKTTGGSSAAGGTVYAQDYTAAQTSLDVTSGSSLNFAWLVDALSLGVPPPSRSFATVIA